jgi:ParB family chromosome partitioning protein
VPAKHGLVRSRRGDLRRYNPDKGLKQIAVAEAAEKHYARAKDPSKLQQAIRAKLTAQAEFVEWWDHVADKFKGGDQRRRSATLVPRAGKNGIPDRSVIERWRRRLADPETFEATYEAALARYISILELEPGAHVGQNSGNNEWYTPAAYIEAARAVLGAIDLDPASSDAANRVVQARTFYSKEDDGLSKSWSGRVWMNPPYAPPLIDQFADKLVASIKAGDVVAAIVLVNNATETDWFTTLVSQAYLVCFTYERVKFWRADTDETAAPLQGQAVLYVGDHYRRFFENFSPFGLVLARADVIPNITCANPDD